MMSDEAEDSLAAVHNELPRDARVLAVSVIFPGLRACPYCGSVWRDHRCHGERGSR